LVVDYFVLSGCTRLTDRWTERDGQTCFDNKTVRMHSLYSQSHGTKWTGLNSKSRGQPTILNLILRDRDAICVTMAYTQWQPCHKWHLNQSSRCDRSSTMSPTNQEIRSQFALQIFCHMQPAIFKLRKRIRDPFATRTSPDKCRRARDDDC